MAQTKEQRDIFQQWRVIYDLRSCDPGQEPVETKMYLKYFFFKCSKWVKTGLWYPWNAVIKLVTLAANFATYNILIVYFLW